MGKNPVCDAGHAGHMGSIPGFGKIPWRRATFHNPLQYSRLENPMDRGAWRAAVHRLQRVGHD